MKSCQTCKIQCNSEHKACSVWFYGRFYPEKLKVLHFFIHCTHLFGLCLLNSFLYFLNIKQYLKFNLLIHLFVYVHLSLILSTFSFSFLSANVFILFKTFADFFENRQSIWTKQEQYICINCVVQTISFGLRPNH